jgi:hypothetical protein
LENPKKYVRLTEEQAEKVIAKRTAYYDPDFFVGE